MNFSLIRSVVSIICVAILVCMPTTKNAYASDLGKILGGAAVLGAGICIFNPEACGVQSQQVEPQQPQRVIRRAPTRQMSPEQRQQNKDIQQSLNAFNFPAGTIDGIIGRGTRSAIQQYQSYMGYNPSGQLTDFERDILVNSYRKLQRGDGYASYPNMMAQEGPRGLLKAEVNPRYPQRFGDLQPTTAPPQVATNYQQPATQPNQYAVNTQPQIANNNNQASPLLHNSEQQLSPISLPPLEPIGKTRTSVAEHCELVGLTAQTLSGTTSTDMTSPDQVLNEKFCEARSYAISQGQFIASQVRASEQELAKGCNEITKHYQSIFPTVENGELEQVVASTKNTAIQVGLTDTQIANAYGQICLGMGYRQDNAEMAFASSLLLIAANERPYGELVGHHLRKGFGVKATPSRSVDWYVDSMTSLENGANPAFEPSTTVNRINVIRSAIGNGLEEYSMIRKSNCTNTAMEPATCLAFNETASLNLSPDVSDVLQRYDDNQNGRITCKEARRHGIAPVPKSHPAYQYMNDSDHDGVICE
ncbi:MAG: peptidoglycan-binding protein [Aestuariivita sp.]|nr:peptidoglycan-binding protein [Aestuariivita sp.]